MAPDCFLDFETYNEANLKQAGAVAYSLHPSADIICLGWSVKGGPKGLWTPGQPFPKPLRLVIQAGGRVKAQGVLFDKSIWNNVARRLHNFPEVVGSQWRCVQAVQAYRALPLALEAVAKVLKLPIQKDMAGNAAMRAISKPLKGGGRATLDTHFNAFQMTYDYCQADVAVTEAVDSYVGDLPPSELKVWQLDMEMQQRGLLIDQELCRAAIAVAAEYEKKLTAELRGLTDGAIQTAGQRDKLLAWLEVNGAFLPNLTADAVDAAIRETAGAAKRVLEIRRYLSRSSHKKYERAMACLCPDGRVRGATQYHGATTGRNVGRLFQPLNMRRPVFNGNTELLADAIKTRDLNFIEMVGGANVMEVLADAVRGIVIAAPGKTLVEVDFSAIEAVVTAAMANEVEKLEVFRRGEDPYCWFASHVTGLTIPGKHDPEFTEQDAKDRQNIGKPGELSFGFLGGVGAWRRFDDSDTFSDEEVEEFKDMWRKRHPRVVAMGKALDNCAIKAVLDPGTPYRYVPPDLAPEFGVAFVVRGDFLLLQLPSGRLLHYFKPSVRETIMPWTKKDGSPIFKPAVHYWTTTDGQWKRARGWRGQWIENTAQAISRDLLVDAWFAAEDGGFPAILTVYDAVLAEVPTENADPKRLIDLALSRIPKYAAHWPVSADAWAGPRFKKG